MPKVPILLKKYPAEGFERGSCRPEIASKFRITLGVESDQHHVVDRQKPPDQKHYRERRRTYLAHMQAQPAWQPERSRHDAHSCTSVVWNLRIRRTPIGISTGRAAIMAATPSCGLPWSKRYSIPCVASTS